MASDGPGKYRERKNRAAKPYDRPKGIIRRVTDSVTGLFSASWLSGWMGGEDDDESSDQQAGSSQTSTVAPAGESFIFAQPITARRPFRPIYPEEGETEGNGQQSLGVNEGASTSSGVRMGVSGTSSVGISATTSRSIQLSGDSPSPSLTGRRHPIISSTPAPMFVSRTKSQLESRSLPLLTSSTPTDEREYQREILQLDDESLQTLRDSLTKSVPSAPVGQSSGALPSLEETRKRPRDFEPDHTSVRAEGSISSKSLFSESSDVILGQPQPSGVASKRPRFNASLYGSICLGEKSVLSDSSFKSSPFYPGKTMYGGASAYRRSRLQPRTPSQTPRVQIRAKTPSESSNDGGLSQAARRILESLEQMSTPISDAKRIPTPTPGQRGSFLDANPSYTAAFHRHRPVLRTSAPPTSRLLTPTKLTVQENLTTCLLPSSSASTSLSSGSPGPKKNANSEGAPRVISDTSISEKGQEKNPPKDSLETFSAFSKASAEAAVKFKPVEPSVSSITAADEPSDVLKFGASSNISMSLNTFEFTPRSNTTMSSFTSDLPQLAKKVGGKMKSRVADSGRSSKRHNDDDVIVEVPRLPAVSLTMTTLPTINLPIHAPSTQGSHVKINSSPKGFTFSTPEIVDTHSDVETLANAPKFTFRNPALIGEVNSSVDDLGTIAVPTVPMMFNSSSPSLGPKLKANNKNAVIPLAGKLREGSILDILKSKGNSPDKLSSISLPSNSFEEKVENSKTENSYLNYKTKLPYEEDRVTKTPQGFKGFGSAFKKSGDEWECSVCMIRNKNSDAKCVACQSQRPEQSIGVGTTEVTTRAASVVEKCSSSLPGGVAGWGDAFKKSGNKWECDMCMLHNTDSAVKCVACEAPKPGSTTVCEISGELNKVDKEDKLNSGFGSAFAKGKDEWECDTCLVRNKSEAVQCISCETPKPGAASVCQAITGNFRFGLNSNDLSSTSSTFKFGLSNSQTQVKSSGFNFGVSAKSTEDSDSKGNSGFKFGVPVEKPNALTGFSFSSNSENVHSKEKSQCASGGFKFGVQSLNSKDSESINKEPSLSFGKSPESSSEPVTAANKTQVAFSFGSGTSLNTTAKENQSKVVSNEVNPATEPTSGNSHDQHIEVKDSKSSEMFSFKSKSDNVDGISKTAFTFNDVIPGHGKDSVANVTKTATPISFGASKITNAGSESCALSFGAKVVESAIPAGGVFTFGDKGAKPFAFASPAGNKEESKSSPSFNFNAKWDSIDTSEPAKKMTFSAANTGGINNGVSSSSSSLFAFGNKENKLSAGSGFGAVPSATPAFGAPAPASNPTPNFQFGNSNPPPPAATAPAPAFGNPAQAFGSATPTFGTNSINNSSTTSFAFGQPAEKKPSAGFDFGQAASNTGSSFNFASGGAQSSNIFQFGQSQANSTPSSGLFAFGAANSEVPAPAPSFGNSENPFTSPAPPSGRVVKKAVRRNRK
ncbi:nuclear pore complex protein Nup153 isoform X2 [Procambarus clarkii]|uniref:nuclear pore complex protein Nup153 isoform X2 n=1 Tax=Procambarus clarkii TaxID=6728 RepID=UPI001E6789C4|nr:nuclear pore complex protein Nup153-like isoform X2 [Procambarus clarkii]